MDRKRKFLARLVALLRFGLGLEFRVTAYGLPWSFRREEGRHVTLQILVGLVCETREREGHVIEGGGVRKGGLLSPRFGWILIATGIE
jgi:hypothetical protein